MPNRPRKPSLLLLLAALALPSAAEANERVLYFASYGGSTERTFRQRVLPAFEAANRVQVRYVAGTSAANLARLQAQRGNPELDVALLDDGPMQQAVGLGLCALVAPSPEVDNLYPIARPEGGRSVALGIATTGIAYNTETFRREGWPAPTSWRDLAEPRFRRRLLIPSITNSYGLHALLMMARIEGGGERNIDSGFALMSRLAPNVLSFEAASAKISELFQTGAVAIGVWGNGRTLALAEAGFPVAFVAPREGAVALQTVLCPVAGSDEPELSQALIRHLLSPETQALLAKESGWGPTGRRTELTPDVARHVVYGPAAVEALVAPDWAAINAGRGDWTRRWSRSVER
jgi:putative spermidine/putrescine transport system substrate-binding protein